MAARVNRGDIWRLDLPHPDKRRPVVVISRRSADGMSGPSAVGQASPRFRRIASADRERLRP